MAVTMPAEITAKQLPQSLFELDGISRNQIEQHYSLYEKYVSMTNKIRSRLRDADPEDVNQN